MDLRSFQKSYDYFKRKTYKYKNCRELVMPYVITKRSDYPHYLEKIVDLFLDYIQNIEDSLL